LFYELEEKSGFGCDDVTGEITLTDENWDDLIKVCSRVLFESERPAVHCLRTRLLASTQVFLTKGFSCLQRNPNFQWLRIHGLTPALRLLRDELPQDQLATGQYATGVRGKRSAKPRSEPQPRLSGSEDEDADGQARPRLTAVSLARLAQPKSHTQDPACIISSESSHLDSEDEHVAQHGVTAEKKSSAASGRRTFACLVRQ
jgi:hypothetical protein